MDSQYHCFRRRVLMARHAYVRELEPGRIANGILAAARELVLLSGRIPRSLLRPENRQVFLGRLVGPALNEPVRLLIQAHVLAEEAEHLESLDEDPCWQQQAYHLIWRLDCFLIELAGVCRSDSVPLPQGVTPVLLVSRACLH